MLSALNQLSVIFSRKSPEVKFALQKVDKFGIHPHFNEDFAQLRFDLDCDLSDIFDWNTHLIFAFLSIEYEGKTSKYNQMTVWDDIIMRSEPENHHIKLSNKRAEYFLTDKYRQLKGKKVKVFFNWEHMPIVGVNYRRKVQVGEIEIPDEYNMFKKRR